ncbi:LysR family transcriptional regulator [Burkholderia stagnalis]|uniref:LysR family transcriptional regulator n=1 Tax=Burkholderia stagnalis TaxID=1503054 RepID=UPI001E437BC5|nr:LysR family transcriptional regulator [Burkholderia stagnalis]
MGEFQVDDWIGPIAGAKRMDLRALQIFKTVVDEGGVARAAERLHCVQSNVSTRIRQLEDMLGTRLFDRVGKRLTVTPRGVVLHGYAARLLELADEARQVMKSTDQPCTELRIGATVATATLHLPRALTEFHRQHPEIQLRVNVATSDSIVRDVLDQALDVGFIVGPGSHDALHQIELDAEELVLLTDRRHPMIRNPKDLANTMIIGFREGCAYRNRLQRWLAEGGVPLTRMLEFDSSEAIVGCVAVGLGAAIMPAAVVGNLGFTDQIQCHPLPEPYALVRTTMIWRADSRHHANHRQLAESFVGRPAPSAALAQTAPAVDVCDTCDL